MQVPPKGEGVHVMDKLLHKVISEQGNVVWRKIEGVPVPYYYAENRLYAFRLTNGIALYYGDNPADAWEKLKEDCK